MSRLPQRPSLEYLKKLAKERLRNLRRADPNARLAAAQLAIAREYGFSSWRALKAEVDRRSAPELAAYVVACEAGDIAALRQLLDRDPALVHQRNPGGATGLHAALRHAEAVRFLLERGADPNVREDGDNALPIHFAAARAPIETVRALLDAGSDVQGVGDDHRMDVIGWATCFAEARRDVVELLLERGAKHNIFSAIAMNDPDAVRRVVSDDPAAIRRRLSHNEQEQSALHYVIAPADGLVGGLFRTGEHYRTLELLIQLGADVEAKDAKGRTPLAMAMLRADREAIRLLHAAGAKTPEPPKTAPLQLSELARSVAKLTPMLGVPDINTTLAWYRAVGFEVAADHQEEGKIDWAMVKFGNAEIMFVPSTDPWRAKTAALSLWLETDRIDELYARLKRQQLARAAAALEGQAADAPELQFTADLYTAFYGQREFGIRDPNGVELMFAQPLT